MQWGIPSKYRKMHELIGCYHDNHSTRCRARNVQFNIMYSFLLLVSKRKEKLSTCIFHLACVQHKTNQVCIKVKNASSNTNEKKKNFFLWKCFSIIISNHSFVPHLSAHNSYGFNKANLQKTNFRRRTLSSRHIELKEISWSSDVYIFVLKKIRKEMENNFFFLHRIFSISCFLNYFQGYNAFTIFVFICFKIWLGYLHMNECSTLSFQRWHILEHVLYYFSIFLPLNIFPFQFEFIFLRSIRHRLTSLTGRAKSG